MKIYGDNGIKITLPSGGGIEDVTVGGVSVVDDNVAIIPEIPTKTSDLTNDRGFITSLSLPTKVSELQNDLGFITQTDIANYVENTDFATTDVGGVIKASDSSKFYVNASGAPIADVVQYQNWASTSDYAFVGKGTLNNVLTAKAYITENDIPSNVSYFTNDAGYITASDIPDPSVDDVQINGTSIVDEDGVADIPVADGNDYGVIKGLSGAGYVADNGELYASTLTAANYGTAQNYLFVSKGTLENVLTSKGYALSSDIPTKVSDLTNDSGFITSSSLPTKVSDLTNDLGFVTASTVPVRDVTIGPNSIVWSDHVAVLPIVLDDYFFEERLSGYLLQPKDIDAAVKAALCDGNGPAYTSTEQAAARQRLGVSGGGGGGGAVDDVQINGTSIVSSGVAEIPILTYLDHSGINGYGLVKAGYGLQYGTNGLEVQYASEYNITSRTASRSISSNRIDFAVKAAMCDGNGDAWTEEEQVRARERLGISGGGGGSVDDVTVGGVSVVEDNVAVIPEIPTKTSDLTNDSGFITSSALPTKVSDLTNDSGFITSSALPTKVSDLTNDSGFITSSSLPTKTSDLTNDSGYITEDDIPVKSVDVNGYDIMRVSNGVLSFHGSSFTHNVNGQVYINDQADSTIKAANSSFRPVTIAKQHVSTFYGLAKAAGVSETGNTIGSYSAASLEAIQDMLGITSGNSDPTAYSPSGSANDASNIQTILDTYKSCRLAPGTYLLESEIAMYDDYCLMGSGPSTVLTFSTSSGSGERALIKLCYAPSGSVADDRGGITVKDLTLRGAETIADSYITSSSSVGNDHGIRTVSDDASIGVYRSPNKVQNVIFEKFTGYCFKQSASAYTNVDYTFGTTGRYTTNRVDFNGCTFRSSHGGYYDSGHNYTTGIAFVDCLFNFLFLGIRIGGMGVDGVNTKFTEIYGQILLCQTAEYYPYLENSFTGCYFDGTHCSESADIRINPYGDPNFRTIFTSCIFIANKGYIYNGTVSCCNCRFVNSKQTYSGYVEMELESLDAITSFICCSSDAIFDTWGQAYSNGKCKFVGCYKDDGTEIK